MMHIILRVKYSPYMCTTHLYVWPFSSICFFLSLSDGTWIYVGYLHIQEMENIMVQLNFRKSSQTCEVTPMTLEHPTNVSKKRIWSFPVTCGCVVVCLWCRIDKSVGRESVSKWMKTQAQGLSNNSSGCKFFYKARYTSYVKHFICNHVIHRPVKNVIWIMPYEGNFNLNMNWIIVSRFHETYRR